MTRDRILCPVYAERVAVIGATLGGLPWGRCPRCYTPTTLDEVNTARACGLNKAHAEPSTIEAQVCPDWAEGTE